MTIVGDSALASREFLPGVPQIPSRFLSRPQLLEALDAGDAGRLIVVRAPAGSGKSTLLSDWLHQADREQPIVWVSLDESAHSRAGFWHRVIQTFISCGLSPTDGPLADFVSGYVDLANVPGLLLTELLDAPHRVRLVLDDLHYIDDATVDEIIWLLERSNRLQVLATTHHRGRLEEPAIMVRLEPTVITGAELAFTVEETCRVLERSDAELLAENASIIHEATGGHPLATRIAITTLAGTAPGAPSALLDRHAVIRGIAGHITQELLPVFSRPENRVIALRIALASSVDSRLAAELAGGPAREQASVQIDQVLRHFEQEGFGEFRGVGAASVFAFHPLVGHALEREAERSLDAAEVATLRRTAAQSLATRGDALGALRLYAKLGEYSEMWPVIARNFSELIIHHQGEIDDIIRNVPAEALQECGTLAIALAIVRSEQLGIPSADVRHLVDTGIARLEREAPATDPLARFWILLSIFAGLRAARRYRQAAIAGDAVVNFVEQMSPETRVAAGHAIGAGQIQIVITYILVGRLDDALALAHRLSHDPHPGRQQHRRSLLAYLNSFRGDMPETEALAQTITHARFDTWRATIPATGWYAAEALIRLERNDPAGALEMISALDSRLAVLEHWPYLLWVKGMARLAGPHPELGADELTVSIAANRSRPASPYALDVLAALRSDFYLTVGQLGRARLVLAARSADSAAISLALARLLLAEDRFDEAKAALAALHWSERATLRQHAESLLLRAAVDLRLGLRSEALHSTRRAFALLDRHGLRLPLVMVPHSELHELVREELPEQLPLFDGLPDPFGAVSTPNPLSPREQEVLIALASVASLETIAGRLFVSVNTIKTQLRSVYRKLGVSSREDAISTARSRGLLTE